MAKIKIKAGKEAVESAQESVEFEEAPPGVYVGEVKEITAGHSKGSDGKPDKDRPRLEVILRLTGVGREGAPFPDGKRYGQVWDYVSFSEESAWKRAQFGIAMGIPVKNGEIDGDIEIDPTKPGTVVGKKVLVVIKADSDNAGNYRAKVRAILSLEASAEGTGDSGLFDDADAPTEGGDIDDNPFADDADSSGGDDLLTKEMLEDTDEYPDLKSLGAVAEEFDLVPQEFIVKGPRGKGVNQEKTRAALIAGILEAQNGTDGDDAGADEDPF